MDLTLPKMFKQVAEKYAAQPAIYYKDEKDIFKNITFTEFYELVKDFGAGLLSLGIKRGDHIGLISDNRKEWIIADLGILAIGAVDVPRGTDSTDDEIIYILQHSDSSLLLVENLKTCKRILARYKEIPRINKIITLDDDFSRNDLKVKKAGITVLKFQEVIDKGKKKITKNPNLFEQELQKGRGSDLATIIYTSGTTGEPKGVMLCHENFLFQVRTVIRLLNIVPGDICLSVLPVWHSFERAAEYIILGHGAAIGYSKPVAQVMLADLATLEPAWFPTVPRIWEGVYAAVYRKIKTEGGLKKGLFKFFVGIGKAHVFLWQMFRGLLPWFKRRIRILDIIISFLALLLLLPLKLLGSLLVFKKIRIKLGTKFKAGISGGGALPPYVDKFFAAVGILLLEGYGLTEAAPIISVRAQKRPVTGTVGPLLQGTTVKIMDEDGNVLKPGKMGVVYVKGGQVMLGYYKKPEETKKVLSDDGWLNTGDLGMVTYKGELKIVGRVKDTIVLRGGENIEPQPIEETILQSEYIDQVLVLGQDQKFLAALIVPNDESIEEYAKKNNIVYKNIDGLRVLPEINKLISSEVDAFISPKNGFKMWERIFRFTILQKHFEVGDELTCSLKMKRPVINKLYKKEIANLFK